MARITANGIDLAIGACISETRRSAGWSLEDLADAVGLSFREMYRVEQGDLRVSAGRLHQIAALFGIAVDDFYRRAMSETHPDVDAEASELLAIPEAVTLLLALRNIKSSKRRKLLTRIAASLGGVDVQEPADQAPMRRNSAIG